ncbi:MAG TPA: hypothetical protein VFL47_01775, partial [Flavisolibacter sp.]|nr:hypothetical protein [Flavisolibacter sp.]
PCFSNYHGFANAGQAAYLRRCSRKRAQVQREETVCAALKAFDSCKSPFGAVETIRIKQSTEFGCALFSLPLVPAQLQILLCCMFFLKALITTSLITPFGHFGCQNHNQVRVG